MLVMQLTFSHGNCYLHAKVKLYRLWTQDLELYTADICRCYFHLAFTPCDNPKARSMR